MGNELSRPIFSPGARSPLFSPNVKSFQRTFAEGDPLRYIVLNATALARYTYVRNSSLGRHREIFRTMYHLKLQLKYDGIFRVNYIRFRLGGCRT